MLPEFQQSGFGIVLLDRLVEAAKPWGLKGWEFSWVLESNASSRGTLEARGDEAREDLPDLRPGAVTRSPQQRVR